MDNSPMKSNGSDWYKNVWSLDIKEQSWTEGTAKEVAFLIDKLGLKGGERILDLACGFGRHALEFARRGWEVVGVDITEAYIADANATAAAEKLPARFICSDIREVAFEGEFDVVLNMADGAIGYLENDAENLKIFDVVARALKPGGKHFMDIMNGGYAEHHYPCQLWSMGETGLTLSKFGWDKATKTLMYAQWDMAYGKTLVKPILDHGNPTRLYDLPEVEEIMRARGMKVRSSYSDYDGNASSDDRIQLMVISEKE